MDDKQISKDRLRYTKNSLSSGLALLAILINVFYFVSIYRSDVGNYYYTYLTGISIIYNLLFMLTVFLCSEGVKNYNMGYAVTMIVVGGLQFVRIFILPTKAYNAIVKIGSEEMPVMGSAQYTRLVAYLVLSGAVLILAGIIGISKTLTLRAYNKELEAARAE